MRGAVLLLFFAVAILIFLTPVDAAQLMYPNGQGQGSCEVTVQQPSVYTDNRLYVFGIFNGDNPRNGISRAYIHTPTRGECQSISGTVANLNPRTHSSGPASISASTFVAYHEDLVPIVRRVGAIAWWRNTRWGGIRNQDHYADFVQFDRVSVSQPTAGASIVIQSGKQCVRAGNFRFNQYTHLLSPQSSWTADGGRSGTFERCNSHMYRRDHFDRPSFQGLHLDGTATYSLPLQAACESYTVTHENGQYSIPAQTIDGGYRFIRFAGGDDAFFEVRLLETAGLLSEIQVNVNYPAIPSSRNAQERVWNYRISCVNPTIDPHAAQALCELPTGADGSWLNTNEENTEGRCCFAQTFGESARDSQGSLHYCNADNVWESSTTYFAGECREQRYGIGAYTRSGQELTQGCFRGLLVREHSAPTRIFFGGTE